MRALVLDGDSRSALAIVRSLGRRGVHVTVASEDEASLAGSSRWCSERLVYPCPRATPRLFQGWLVSTLASTWDTVLFTASDITTSIAGRCRLSLPEAARALLPPQKSLEVAFDKSATVDLALRLGVPVPKSVLFERKEPVDASRVTFGFPAAVKSAKSDLPYRFATSYAPDLGDMRVLLDEALRESPAALVQEVIVGQGTAVFALYDSGRPLVTFAHRRLIEKPPWGGVSALSESIDPPPDALDFALAMLRELSWHGPAMVEFKRAGQGAPHLMEINPRFWGSLELAIRSGVDFPYMAFLLASGERVEAPPVRRAVNRWVLGELDSLTTSLITGAPGRSRLAGLGSHLSSLRYGPCCEVERVSDPKPAIYEYAAWLRTSAGRFAARWKGGPVRSRSPRGVVHVHTAFSADGFLQPREIAELCRERGLAFAAIADHAEDVDEAAMDRLVKACQDHSRGGFALIPGLEHRLPGEVHILALGQKRLVKAASPVEMLEAIANDGCVLVASHCSARCELPARVLEMLSAVETWNVSRDTRFLPTSGGFAAYRRWAPANPNLCAIGGLDMHSENQWGCQVVLDRGCEISPESVLSGIREGRFFTKGRFASFASRPTGGIRDMVFTAGDALASVRDVRDRVLR